jgi:hypothetical protein
MPSSQAGGVPVAQPVVPSAPAAPGAHRSGPLQAAPSSQAPSSGRWTQVPPAAVVAQASFVQMSPSSHSASDVHSIGVWQPAAASQTIPSVQRP